MESRAYETPYMLQKRGIQALSKELGPVGMVRFLSQYDSGVGDYTAERQKSSEGITIDEIVARIEKKRG